jgi:hypothetical protein
MFNWFKKYKDSRRQIENLIEDVLDSDLKLLRVEHERDLFKLELAFAEEKQKIMVENAARRAQEEVRTIQARLDFIEKYGVIPGTAKFYRNGDTCIPEAMKKVKRG